MCLDEKEKLPIICQINFEIHYPPERFGYSMNDALERVHKFFADDTYTVFNMELFLQMMRVYVVNTKDLECVEKFLCSK